MIIELVEEMKIVVQIGLLWRIEEYIGANCDCVCCVLEEEKGRDFESISSEFAPISFYLLIDYYHPLLTVTSAGI